MASASTVREESSSSDSSSPSKKEEHVGKEIEEHSSNKEESEEIVADEGSSKEEEEQMEEEENDEDEAEDEEVHENRTKNKEDNVDEHGKPEKVSSSKRRVIENDNISEDYKNKNKKKTKTRQSSHLALPEEEKTKTEAEDNSGKLKVAIHQLQPFQKVWNDTDEIQLLKSLVRFSSKSGVSIENLDMGKFHEYVKDSIQFDASRTQVTEKIRRLKIKYNNNLRKGSINLSNPHDEKVFRLSKKTWGAENPQRELPSNSGELKIQNTVPFDWTPYPRLKKSLEMGGENPIGNFFDSLNDPILYQLMHTIPDSKLQKMEEELQKLHVEEAQLHLKSVELMGNHAKVFRAFMKYSFHGN